MNYNDLHPFTTWRDFFIVSPYITQEEIDQVQELGWAQISNLYRQHSAGLQAQRTQRLNSNEVLIQH